MTPEDSLKAKEVERGEKPRLAIALATALGDRKSVV